MRKDSVISIDKGLQNKRLHRRQHNSLNLELVERIVQQATNHEGICTSAGGQHNTPAVQQDLDGEI